MKTSVDALVLIGHANKISHEVPGFVAAHVTDTLEKLRGPSYSELHDITTEADMNNLLAAETILSLGSLVTSRFVGVPIVRKYPNAFRDTAIDIIDEISPFQKGTVLDPAVSKFLGMSGGVTDDETRDMFSIAVGEHPADLELFRQKWLRSVELFKRRGEVVVKAYRKDELMKAISEVNLNDIPPDTFEFDIEAEQLKETRTMDSLIEHTEVPLHEVAMPYYATMRQSNATELYADAVMDLRDLGVAIQDINAQN